MQKKLVPNFTKESFIFPLMDVPDKIPSSLGSTSMKNGHSPENIKLVDKLEGTDPLEISEKIGGYLSLKTKLEQFKRLKEEYAPVYERKGGEDTL